MESLPIRSRHIPCAEAAPPSEQAVAYRSIRQAELSLLSERKLAEHRFTHDRFA
jgi:hypothetical protein